MVEYPGNKQCSNLDEGFDVRIIELSAVFFESSFISSDI